MNPEDEWKNMPDGKEKYSRYLASREWARLRRQVFKRCESPYWRHRGTNWTPCERCYAQPAKYVHHLTYERKYHESLDDLLAVCEDCHAFIHDSDSADPLTYVNALAVHVNFYDGSYGPADIICPVCGDDCEHVGKPFTDETCLSPHIVIPCSGDCGHKWEIYIITREGNTFIGSCHNGLAD